MKVMIFTDESGVKLPEIKRNGKIGVAKDITKNEEFMSFLQEEKLKIPTDDMENENVYLNNLDENYIRPAKYMFGGMFKEVSDFTETLKDIVPTDLFIISGRYGLIRSNKTIIPYVSHIKNADGLDTLNDKTSFLQDMKDVSSDADLIILCLPAHYISYLLEMDFFTNKETDYILVSSPKFANQFPSEINVSIFERKGVARLGSSNREKIIDRIRSIDD